MSEPLVWSEVEEFEKEGDGSLTWAALEARAEADAAWLARERAGQNELLFSLAEELDALLETMQLGEPSQQAETEQTDPPGWPDL